MTKKEMVNVFVEMELGIIAEKKALQTKLNECFDGFGTITDPARYDELIKRYEFFNGQQALIGQQIQAFNLNRNSQYMNAFLEAEMAQMRKEAK